MAIEKEEVDVAVIGAGLSGIDAGYRLKEMTNLSYTIYEQKPVLGGTWRLFTYPGIRCDSDMYTLGASPRASPLTFFFSFPCAN